MSKVKRLGKKRRKKNIRYNIIDEKDKTVGLLSQDVIPLRL